MAILTDRRKRPQRRERTATAPKRLTPLRLRCTKFAMLNGLGHRRVRTMTIALVVVSSCWCGVLFAEELPILKDSSINDFQNRSEDARSYDFDAPPQGLFRSITMAEGFEEELGYRRTHEIVPIKPT